MSQTDRRPFGVSFLSLLVAVMGVIQIGAGIVVLVQRNDDDTLDTLELTSSEATTAGIVGIIVGVLAILISGALRRGANWARLLVGLLAAVNAAILVWAALSFHEVHWYNVMWPTVIYALVAGYLFFDDDAQAYFR